MITNNDRVPEGYKFCECGCKEIILIKDKKGRPRRFKNHHARRGTIGLRGDKNPNWRGGRRKKTDNYIEVYSPDHPYRSKRNTVYEHRLVMEKKEGRYLLPEEEVHHIVKVSEGGTNDIENLMLFDSKSAHRKFEIKKLDTTNRFCIICNKKTYVYPKTGKEAWFNHDNGFVCRKCHLKE